LRREPGRISFLIVFLIQHERHGEEPAGDEREKTHDGRRKDGELKPVLVVNPPNRHHPPAHESDADKKPETPAGATGRAVGGKTVAGSQTAGCDLKDVA